MDMEKAVKFLRNHFKIGIYEKISKEIIALIKQLDKKSIRGEKYEAIVKEIKYEIDWHRPERGIHDVGSEMDDEYINETLSLIDKIEQKYFPKPSKDFTEKVMDKINNEGER